MALNPPLYSNRMPEPFQNEVYVLVREAVEFEVNKIPGASGGKVSAKGIIYLTNVRMVFVANKPVGNFQAFDMPLLYIHEEKFNQPILFCNNISGKVDPVIPPDANRALYSTHSFKIIFKEGGCGTFIPQFFAVLRSARMYYQMLSSSADVSPRADPLQVGEPPAETINRAFMDPNDPSIYILVQPQPDSQLRRRSYHPQTVEDSI